MARQREKMKEKVLQALRDAGKEGITNVELARNVAPRYGGYMGTFYREGYKIDVVHIGNDVYTYTLISEPKTIVKHEKAWDVLITKAKELGISEDTMTKLFNDNGIQVKYVANTYKK